MEMERLDDRNPADVERWAAELAVSPERLREAIRAVGTDIDKIKGHLAAEGRHVNQDRSE